MQHHQGLHLYFLNLLLAFEFLSVAHFELIVVNCLSRGSNPFFAREYSTVMGPFTEKPVLSSLNDFRESLTENQLTLKFTPHIHMSVLTPESRCLYYCNF